MRRLFKPRPAVTAGRELYNIAATQGRNPAFYRDAGAPDTPEGRFELYLVHVVLLVRRLRHEGPQARETSQAMFDAFLRGLDDGLREMGVGDLSVGKKMRKLGEAFYGRAKAFDAAFASETPVTSLAALIGRTLYGPDASVAAALTIARYALAAEAELSTQPIEALLDGRVSFPDPGPFVTAADKDARPGA